jgi:chorismate mutase/prephenate dehydratase
VSDNKDLNRLRAEIDALDEQIQALITERARAAEAVARAKKEAGEGDFYRPEREAEILRRVAERNEGPLSDSEIARLFREIISACLALEAPQTIAYLGPEGTFTQQAVFKHFGHSVNTLPLNAIDEIFREVEAGGADFGVVPVENSTEGVINHTLDLFLRSELKICGEVRLRVHHHLLSRQDKLSGVKRVVSHQQSLAQCREWLNANLPNVERATVSSNAEAARQAAADASLAAIAGESAAEIYGLDRLASNIEDEPNNTTRFLVIGKLETRPSGKDKTSIMVSSKNKPGALYDLLGAVARHGINMTRIESRPSRQAAWEYVFFLDLEGHAAESPVRDAVHELERESALFRILGSYPAADL